MDRKKTMLMCGILSTCLIGTACSSSSKHYKHPRSRDWSYDRHGEDSRSERGGFPRYNPDAAVKIYGELIGINRTSSAQGQESYIQMILGTDRGEVPVLLGPDWYVQDGLYQLQRGDDIEVRGSEIYRHGRVMIIAKEVYSNKYELRLRDDNGFPLWSGWRKR